ncbi:MAG: ABC transporter substrate-binding protein [Rhodospirillaceae bacterium]|nr:ABC transporter substrate-binding protein [Rhodospirillaceae bacterium]
MRPTRLLSVCAGLIVAAAMSTNALAEQKKLYVYTSMKESLIGGLKSAFLKKHPDIDMVHQSAGAGKLMAKIAAERESGHIMADVLWTSEVPDFYQLKKEGVLHPYVSPEFKAAINPLPDYDGSFTAIRLGTLGIAYNTRYVKTPPTAWADLKKPAFKKAFGVANPALSGTSYMSVALLSKTFGWGFFEDLRKNGAKMGKGSGQVVDDTASGELLASLGVDYITLDKISKGATLGLAYPPEVIVIPSPAAIIKGTEHLEVAKLFIDFLLSKEGQTIIAEGGTLPVRTDVEVPGKYNLPQVADAMKRSIKIDYPALIAEKEATVKTFTAIMQK